MAPRLSPIDPYRMALFAVDEAVRNVVTAGGDPDTLCLLDNFCWPDPVASAKNPEGAYKLGSWCAHARVSMTFAKPMARRWSSGKDSMKNDFRGKDARGSDINISCLPTLMITAMAKVEMGTSTGSAFRSAGRPDLPARRKNRARAGGLGIRLCLHHTGRSRPLDQPAAQPCALPQIPCGPENRLHPLGA